MDIKGEGRLARPALTEEQVVKKANTIIEEYLLTNDIQETLQCVAELNSASLLYVFVRCAVELTLERKTMAREQIGLLLYQLIQAGTLPTQQYYKGLEEILEAAEDIAIDIPRIWLYLAELITPMLQKGGILMGHLFRETLKTILPLGKADVLLAEIFNLLCKETTPEKVSNMWTDSGLNCNDFLPNDKDVSKFVTEQKMNFQDVVQAELPAEAADETEDNQDAQADNPKDIPEPTKQKNQNEEQHNPLKDRKLYHREVLTTPQVICTNMIKPQDPKISAVLDKENKTSLPPNDEAPLMNVTQDFTSSYLNFGSRSAAGPRCFQHGQSMELRKISNSIQLHKAENAWRPVVKKFNHSHRGRDLKEGDPEKAKTQELFRCVRCILNKLTPQKFQKLIEKMRELMIDTEERLKGAIDLIFEKAISEPHFSVTYAKMCHCLMELKVSSSRTPGVNADFHKLLINHCQKEFEKDKRDDEILKKKQRVLEACKNEDKRQHLKEELEEARDKARRRSLGNMKFIGELFRLKMLKEPIMHKCVKILLKKHDEEPLECLCKLLSTIGKDLDHLKAKSHIDKYFNQIDKIIKERKTSSRIRFKLLDLMDLRKSNWVPRRGDQGPKTIDQIHQEAEMEEHREQIKVQQQLIFKKEEGGGRICRDMWFRGPRRAGNDRATQSRDGRRNTKLISEDRPIDTNRLMKITKLIALDFNSHLLLPGGKHMQDAWTKGCSGGTGTNPGSKDHSSVRQRSESMSSTGSCCGVPQRSNSSGECGGNKDKSNHKREPFNRSHHSEGQEDHDDRESQKQGGRNQVSPEPGHHVVPQQQRQRRGRWRKQR
ncbi:eukaryotic translation initiation factor 4 gamma 1-like [Solea solea]|uniref:eukaryotic translation initiation factor 4 gamma 1-like n=1 Tax=Solea solea TaxID=90069 RepID=UPI00272B57EA|nr:eukaryotic translation initiation factor 4 gamma 1-like [Solea solea]